MKEYTVENTDTGQRLDKYLFKILNSASVSFVYKMLRKNNLQRREQAIGWSPRTGDGNKTCLETLKESFWSDRNVLKLERPANLDKISFSI